MLYYIPSEPDMSPDNIEVFAPTTETLFRIAGTPENNLGDISFEGLDMLCTRGDYASRHVDADGTVRLTASDSQSVSGANGAIDISYAHSCSFDHCNIYDVGLHAISIGAGCSDIHVEN